VVKDVLGLLLRLFWKYFVAISISAAATVLFRSLRVWLIWPAAVLLALSIAALISQGAKWHQLFGSETAGLRRWKFLELRRSEPGEVAAVLQQAVRERNTTLTIWTFSILLHAQGAAPSWKLIADVMKRDPDTSEFLLEAVLPRTEVNESSPDHPAHWLQTLGSDYQLALRTGNFYLDRARPLEGKDKAGLIWNKSQAVRFLGRAKAIAPDRAAAAAVAVEYEQALYLMYKGSGPKNE
jgi:hypothetical protein